MGTFCDPEIAWQKGRQKETAQLMAFGKERAGKVPERKGPKTRHGSQNHAPGTNPDLP